MAEPRIHCLETRGRGRLAMVLEVIIGCLAVYGGVMIIWQLWHRQSRLFDRMTPTVLVVVEGAEDWIEWFLRKLSLHMYSSGYGVSDIVIIDVSAASATAEIVSRMQQTCPYVTYVPSTRSRCWFDAVAIMEASRKTQALLMEVHGPSEMDRAIHMITQVSV